MYNIRNIDTYTHIFYVYTNLSISILEIFYNFSSCIGIQIENNWLDYHKSLFFITYIIL